MDQPDLSSWEHVSQWYSDIVGKEGHTQHRTIVPKLINCLTENTPSQKIDSILDIGCGNGVLVEYLSEQVNYLGIDIAPSLINNAQTRKKTPNWAFQVADAMDPDLDLKRTFSHVVALLAMQNISDGRVVLANVAKHLSPNGIFGLLINHPAFRVPKNTHWCHDPHQRRFFRRVDQYLTPITIPIQSKPSQGNRSPVTLSYHNSLSEYFSWIKQAQLSVIDFQEWINEAKQAGKGDGMRHASKEIPLFAVIICKK